MERLGIYGGTFAPPHNGHVAAARAFVEDARLDRLLIFPAGIPPHKQIAADDDPAHRLAMARIAFADVPRAEVSDWEIRQSGRSYTVLTLEHLAAPDRELVLLTGTDMFLTLDQWYRPADIFRLAEICCIRREADAEKSAQIEKKFSEYWELFGARVRLLEEDALVLSSSELRGIVAGGGDLAPYLPNGVADYIAAHRLYRAAQNGSITPADLDALKDRLAAEQSPARFAHTCGVEQTALRIGALCAPGELYRLRAAALLHDATKEYPCEKQLKIAAESGIIVFDCEKTSSALLHAASAAALIGSDPAYSAFADPAVIDAVRWHTTGREGMSVLEQIIFLADYIEPTRTHAACAALREQFWAADPAAMDEDARFAHLRRFVCLEAEQTIRHLLDRGAPIAENTLRARNWALASN
ncbi:MAG: nicotinate (nicotinamide) nucleotide adenylyltransferase [Clostridia bacterium]|nr:nicotinate (nicotinamide) nucleotide adenylyltransferase [Clostridia bacterium]